MPLIGDKFTETASGGRPVVGKVTGIRAALGATLQCDALTSWPTNTAVHFATYKVDTSNKKIGSSQIDWKGIVSGTTLTVMTLQAGTDVGNAVGDYVEMTPTAAWGQDLATGLEVGHNNDGTHKASLPLTSPVLTTPTIADFTNAAHSHNSAASGGSLTSPKVITGINDTNANTLVGVTATASAVNYVRVTNAATGTVGPILAADGETNVDLKIAGKGTGKIHRTSGVYGDITTDTDGATITFDMSVANLHTVVLAGNRTLAVSSVGVGQTFIIRLVQDGTGTRTVTWFTTIKWAGGTAPTLTTTINKADVLGFICTSAGNYDGFVVGANL